MILSLGLMAFNAYLITKNKPKSSKAMFIISIISFIWAIFGLAAAALTTDGYNKTCEQFVRSGAPCEFIFHQGFFEGQAQVLYRKNAGTVKAAIAFGWISVVAFGLYGHHEYKNWRRSLYNR